MFIVYKILCSVNQKSYIGYTKHTLDARWKSHLKQAKAGRQTKLCNAIRKYGESNFSRTILEQVNTRPEAEKLEIELIAKQRTQALGYNITRGGDGGNTSINRTPEWNKHISEALKGRPKTAEHRANLCGPRSTISGSGNPFYGRTHTDETKMKIAKRPYIKGENHHFYGKPTATSFKAGSEHPRSSPVTINGVEYGSLSLAASALKMTRPRLQRWLKAGRVIPPVPSL